ncbi:MAG TPA: DUF1553 domain-containing protein, partial [Candidatus Limnocylindria bacterium]|nr:DUF1553 domain-containing protein [Candidatus Limnocylindria bacterium]
KLVREIVLSRTYQLSWRDELRESPSDRSGTRVTRPSDVDPENRLISRANRRRLDAECLRDTMLFVSGQLKEERSGLSFKPSLSADYGFAFNEPRRSVYAPAFRNALPEMFEAFDFADPSMVTGVRNVSTVAPQALFLMNHPFVREQAQFAARRLLAENLPSDNSKVRGAYLRVLGRPPTSGEMALAEKQLNAGRDPAETWTDIFHALFASMDFRYVN